MIRLRLEELELPVGPGTLLRITVNDDGHGDFFGPEGPRLGGGYTIRVNDDRWRAVLERVTAAADGRSRVTVRIKGRYGEDCQPPALPSPLC